MVDRDVNEPEAMILKYFDELGESLNDSAKASRLLDRIDFFFHRSKIFQNISDRERFQAPW